MVIPSDLAQQRQHWIDVVNKGDVEGYVNLLSTDGIWLPPGDKAVVGRNAFREWLAPFVARFTYEFTISDETIRVLGSFAIELGRFSSRLAPRGGGTVTEHRGSYLILWQKTSDGIWRIDRYIDGV